MLTAMKSKDLLLWTCERDAEWMAVHTIINRSRANTFSKTHYHVGRRWKKQRNKRETKQNKTNTIQKDGGEERQEEYPTFVPLTCKH